jgi:uncharacterized protein
MTRASEAIFVAIRKGEYATAWLLMITLSQQGDADAERYLKFMYSNREPSEDGDTLKWSRLAADHGDADFQCELGVMYERGRGVRRDSTEALKWYRLAADQGYAKHSAISGV